MAKKQRKADNKRAGNGVVNVNIPTPAMPLSSHPELPPNNGTQRRQMDPYLENMRNIVFGNK